MTRIHTITITKLNCDKFQVRTDSSLNEGHFETIKEARTKALNIVRVLENQKLLAKIEYVNVA